MHPNISIFQHFSGPPNVMSKNFKTKVVFQDFPRDLKFDREKSRNFQEVWECYRRV